MKVVNVFLRKRRLLFAFFSLPLAVSATLIDFENFPGTNNPIPDSTVLNTQYAGLTFANTIIYKAQYTLDEAEFPPHSGVNVASDFNGPIFITFATPITFFSGFFTYSTKLTVEALDNMAAPIGGLVAMSKFNNNEQVSGDSGSASNELIQIGSTAAGSMPFNFVELEGGLSGGSFTVDDINYSAAAGAPEPSTFFLIAGSTLFLAIGRKRKRIRLRSSCAILVPLAAAAFCLAPVMRAATISATASQTFIAPNAPTMVTITAIVDVAPCAMPPAPPCIISTSLLLQQIDQSGAILNPNLGTLTLTATQPPTGSMFSVMVNLNFPAGPVFLQVSGGFAGSLKRTPSNKIQLLAGPAPTGAITNVTFTGNRRITRDMFGGTQPITPAPGDWVNTNAPAANNPICYVANDTMGATIIFTQNPIPPMAIPNVTVTGTINGPQGPTMFTAANVTLPAANTATVMGLKADRALMANLTQNAMLMITWSWTDGVNTTQLGTTSNQLYVVLAPPTNTTLFLTTLTLGVANGGATNQDQAIANTWARFSTRNVTTWDGRQLIYYPAGIGFSGCQTDESTLLTSGIGGAGGPAAAGQCGSMAFLLAGAFNANGIPVDAGTGMPLVTVDTGGTRQWFLVNNWAFGNMSIKAMDPTFPYRFTVNPLAPSRPDIMVPAQPGNIYGDLTSMAGIPGQNNPTPSEKVYFQHFIVKPDVGTVYYDPSYGTTYTGTAAQAAMAFQTAAVAGFVELPTAIPMNMDAANEFRVQTTAGAAAQVVNFSR
jgi:hypothetical protein